MFREKEEKKFRILLTESLGDICLQHFSIRLRNKKVFGASEHFSVRLRNIFSRAFSRVIIEQIFQHDGAHAWPPAASVSSFAGRSSVTSPSQ